MSGKLFSKQALRTALFIIFASQCLNTSVECMKSRSKITFVNESIADLESMLEYHFHTYFEVNDPVQVAHAIDLRNEIIANCVAKKIIAVPLHWNYDPENPKLERKLPKILLNVIRNHLLIRRFSIIKITMIQPV